MYSPVVFEYVISIISPNLYSLKIFLKRNPSTGLKKLGMNVAKYSILYSLMTGSPYNGLNSIEQSS